MTVDPSAAVAAMGDGTVPTDAASALEDVSYDLWLDDQDLMRRMQLDAPGGGGMTITTDDWGEPVTVKAPPASAIIQLPGSAGSAG